MKKEYKPLQTICFMDFDTLVQKIIEKTGFTNEEVNQKILEKQQELSNLVSKEGAAYIVAKELGLDIFPRVKRRLEIKNVIPKIRNLNLSGRIVKIFEPKEFERNGRKGKVASVIIGDSTGTIRLSLWDVQTDIIEKLKPGMAIETFGAYTKDDGIGGVEIRLSGRGGLKILEESELPPLEKLERLPQVKIERKRILNLKEGDSSEIRAAMVQLFETNIFYEICPSCGSRVTKVENQFKCDEHGIVKPDKAIVLSGVIDDGTGNIRAVFFRNAALQLIGMDLKDALEKEDSLFDSIDILGKEFIILGRVRRNKMFNRLEFIVNNVKEVDVVSEANKIINRLASNV